MSFWVLIIALCFGSFLNVVIYRLPRNESIVWPGSHCTNCGYKLQARDLIPVLSYIALHRKCRSCAEPISARYPIVEGLTALSFVFVYLKWGLCLRSIVGWVFTGILIIVALIDIDEGIIPDLITYPGMILGIGFSFFTIGLRKSLLGMLVFFFLFVLIAFFSRGGLGGGM